LSEEKIMPSALSEKTPTKFEAVEPTPHDSVVARESSRQMASFLGGLPSVEQGTDSDVVVIQLPHHGNSLGQSHDALELPVAALRLLMQALAKMGEGHAVRLMPVVTELSTFEAADLLNVSRPHAIKLMDEGKIPFHRVGTHRRVLLQDLLDYKRRDDEKRHQILDELSAQAQELNMGY
jgi:excisionase family DNA binding protein